MLRRFVCLLVLATPLSLTAQQTPAAPPVRPQLPHRSLRGLTVPDEPEHPEPAAQDFRDKRYGVVFRVPVGWNFERKDGILSNFGVETRSSRRRSDVRGVAAINFNPWPPTTFAGAIFYYSVIPRMKDDQCAVQTMSKNVKPLPDAEVGGMSFHHGRDHHGAVCTEARDEVFTAMHGSACLRFDLVVNTFCSETSGAMELNPAQLKDVDERLAGILSTVKIDR